MKNCPASPTRRCLAASAALALHFAAPAALAATRYWDGGNADIPANGNNVSTGVTGTWNTTLLNWDAGGVPHVAWNNAANDTAEINGGTQALTLDSAITVGGITQKAGGSSPSSINEGVGLHSITLGQNSIFSVAANTTTARGLNVNASVTGNFNLSIVGPTAAPGGFVNLNRINSYTGSTTITNTTLRIGFASSPGQLGNGTYANTISIGSSASFQYASSLDQTLSGIISGGGGLSKTSTVANTSTLTLTNANTYTGTTTIESGVLEVAGLAAINTDSSIGRGSVGGSAADLVLAGGTLRYAGTAATTTNRLFTIGNANGLSATLDSSAATAGNTLSFNGTSALGLAGSGARTLTLTGTNTGDNTLAPGIGDGAGGATTVQKTGTGKWVLNGNNNYTGTTSISGGTLLLPSTLALGSATALPATAPMVLGGGTAATLSTGGFSNSTGSLTLGAGTNVIDFGAAVAANTLTFANITSFAGTLAIWNWTSTFDNLVFTANGSSIDLSAVNFYSDAGTTLLGGGGALFTGSGTGIGTGELVPVPEPTALLGALAMVGLALRRRR